MTLALRALRFSYISSVLAAKPTLYMDQWTTQGGTSREGLRLGVAKAQCDFGWMFLKINSGTLGVRDEHSRRVVAGVPLLHSSYKKRWREVRDLGDIYMRLHQAEDWAVKYKINQEQSSTGRSHITPTAKRKAWLSYLTH